MKNVTCTELFAQKIPHFIGIALSAEIVNGENNEALWKDFREEMERIKAQYTVESVKENTAVLATRKAYRTLGKDPSRYRPSSEALIRRILQNKEIRAINTLVDLGNLVSVKSGYSIGIFDADKIEGENLVLDIGQTGEPYNGIGHSNLNIENLPVYKDNIGGIGTPTSDNVRTQVSLQTRRTLALINGYDGNEDRILQAAELLIDCMGKYAQGHNFEQRTFRATL